MEMHFHTADKNDTRRNIREHRQTGCHIIWLCTDKTSNYDHPQIRRPENKIVDIQSERIQKVCRNQRPVFFKISQHRPVISTVLTEITSYHRKLQSRDQPESDRQCQKHTVGDAFM